MVLVVVDVAVDVAVGDVVAAEVVGCRWVGGDDQLLDFPLQVGVFLDLLSNKDDSGRGQGVSGLSGQWPILLTFAVNNCRHCVALHADTQPVPPSIVEA